MLHGFSGVALTAKGLELLKAVPDSLGDSFRERLRDAASVEGREGLRALAWWRGRIYVINALYSACSDHPAAAACKGMTHNPSRHPLKRLYRAADAARSTAQHGACRTMNDGKGAEGRQPGCEVAQLDQEPLTPTERMLIRFYRQLGEGEQAFMRRAIEAVATKSKSQIR